MWIIWVYSFLKFAASIVITHKSVSKRSRAFITVIAHIRTLSLKFRHFQIRVLKQLITPWKDLFKRNKNIKKLFFELFRKALRSNLNCEINLILIWPEDCAFFCNRRKFKITDTKLYVPVVTLSIQDSAKLLQQLKSGFKRAINWNKYQTKVLTEGVNQYLDFLIDPRFQGVNILFVLSFENEGDRKVHTGYNLPKVETKDYNVLIDGENFFDQPVKNNTRTYDNIRKTSSGQGDEYTTGCLLDYNYFKEHYKMIAIYLSKEQELDCDPKAVQQVNFTGNLENQSKMFFFTEDAKETVLDFSQGIVKVF